LGDASVISATNSLEIEVGGDDGESSISQSAMRLFSFKFLMMCCVTAFFVFLAVDLFTMERLVHGAGPQLLSEILGVNWEKLYSLRSLMWTTGASGGWDYMLMGTFGLFCVVGPFLRAVFLILTVLLDQCKIPVSCLATAVSFLGSFCSWEVFAIAIVMVQMLMPTITGTIVKNPVCGKISGDGSCLTVEFNVIPYAFATVILGGFMLVGFSWVTTGRTTQHDTVQNRNDSLGGVTAIVASTNEGGPSVLSRVMTPYHNYQRLHGIEEGVEENIDSGLEELVFETNQV
jgi:hypothetical protein